MKNEKVIKAIVQGNPAFTDKLTKTIDYYQSVSDIINRTYVAMGRKKTTQFSTIASTKGKFNVKSIRSTAKI